jgi:hypothetical protein
MEKKKVTFNVNEELYFEYKKVLIDKRTNPTADFARHMKEVVEKAKQSKETEEK